jgi:hypothetical protein
VTETLYVVDPPCDTVWLAGLAASEKSGCETTSVTVALRVSDPPVPVMVTMEAPVGVDAPVATVIVELPVAGFGVNVAVAPAGKPVAASETAPAKPPVGTTATSYDAEFPGLTVRLAGDPEMAKSGWLQPWNLNVPIRVRQLNDPAAGMYSLVNQNVQSSTGSTVRLA